MLRSASSCCCSSTGNAWYLHAQPQSALNASIMHISQSTAEHGTFITHTM